MNAIDPYRVGFDDDILEYRHAYRLWICEYYSAIRKWKFRKYCGAQIMFVVFDRSRHVESIVAMIANTLIDIERRPPRVGAVFGDHLDVGWIVSRPLDELL